MNSTGDQSVAHSTKSRSVLIACILFVAWLVAYVDRIVIGTAIIPIAKDFHLDATQKGYVLSAFYISYAFMQLGGGAITDRFGPRIALIGCLTTWSLFTGFTGVAWSLPVLIIARFLFGLAEGGFSPASASAVATYFPHKDRARLQALMGSTGFIGSALGAATMAWLVATFGWRPSFQGLAVAGFVVVLGILVIMPARGQTSGEFNPTTRPSWLKVARTPGTMEHRTPLVLCLHGLGRRSDLDANLFGGHQGSVFG